MSLKQKKGGALSKEQLDFYQKEGCFVLPDFLSENDMHSAIQAMQEKVSRIADGLMANGLIKNKLEELPFHLRLVKLFTGLSDKQFLKYGRGWSLDLRYQPSNQDPLLNHGVGFLARSYKTPEKVATLEDWMAERLEHQ